MPKSALQIWGPEAAKIRMEEAAAKQPIHVQRGEAVDLANLLVKYAKAVRDTKTGVVKRPGFDMLGDRLPPSTSDDLLSQQSALGEAQDVYLQAAGQKAIDPMKRAVYVYNELEAGLEFLFDDGVEDDNDARLAAVQASHASFPDSIDAMAQGLEDYANLAQLHVKELDGLGGFEVSVIPEAFTLAGALRDKPANPMMARDPKSRDALLVRNQMSTLLARNVAKVRSAARFLFRDHPDIIREFGSAYEKRKRAASRRKQKAADGKPGSGTNE